MISSCQYYSPAFEDSLGALKPLLAMSVHLGIVMCPLSLCQVLKNKKLCPDTREYFALLLWTLQDTLIRWTLPTLLLSETRILGVAGIKFVQRKKERKTERSGVPLTPSPCEVLNLIYFHLLLSFPIIYTLLPATMTISCRLQIAAVCSLLVHKRYKKSMGL
jgi:hypothetical protein